MTLHAGNGWFGWGIFLLGGILVVVTCVGVQGVLAIGRLPRGKLCRVSFWVHYSYRNHSLAVIDVPIMKYCTHLGVLDLIMENDVTGENWQPQAA